MRSIGLGTVGFIIALASPAAAQTAGGAVEPAPAASDDFDGIVVTAQRRSERLQDIPAAISAVGQQQLEASGVTNIAALPKLVPNLNITDTLGYIQPYIRGVGATNNANGVYTSVASYYDGLYIARMTSGNLELDNVERIEVLAGPQGALYGRNATGGAILVTTTTPKPGDPLSGRIKLGYGTYDDRQVSATLSSGLGDHAAFSVSGAWHKRDGFIKNLNPAPYHQDDFDDKNVYTFGAKLRLEPADWIGVTLSGTHTRAFERVNYRPPLNNRAGAVAGLTEPQSYLYNILRSFGQSATTAFNNAQNADFALDPRTIYDSIRNGYENGLLPGKHKRGAFLYQRDTLASAEITLRPSDAFEIVSLTGYTKSLTKTVTGVTGEGPGSAGFPYGYGVSLYSPGETWQQELHAASTSGPIDWIVGGFYFREHGNYQSTNDILTGASSRRVNLDYIDDSLSAYAQVGVPVTDQLKLIVGGRYTDEKYSIRDKLAGGVGDISRSFSKFTYTGKAQYTFSPTAMVYASVSTGFKSGTLNPSGPRNGSAGPETLRTYEFGWKTQFANRRIRLNGAIYLSQWKNIHNNVLDTGTGGSFLIDGANAKIYGIEMALNVKVTDRLGIDVSGNLLSAKYTNNVFPSFCCATGLLVDGKDVAGAPKATAIVAVNYTLPTSLGPVRFDVDGAYNDGFYFDVNNRAATGGDYPKSFIVANARVSLTLDDERWTLSAWGRNIFGETYYRAGIAVSGVHPLAVVGQPAQFGGSIAYRF